MPSELVTTLAQRNLTSWFLLPLINLNRSSFGEGNFIESYVNTEGSVLTVEVISLVYCESFKGHDQYLEEHEPMDDRYASVWFSLPFEWREDFLRFKYGKYSQFSTRAKRRINIYGGGPDIRLMALERDPILRHQWEDELEVTSLTAKDELLPLPSIDTYREYI